MKISSALEVVVWLELHPFDKHAFMLGKLCTELFHTWFQPWYLSTGLGTSLARLLLGHVE